MTSTERNELDDRLRELVSWGGADERVWARALARSRRDRALSRAGAAAVLLIVVAIVSVVAGGPGASGLARGFGDLAVEEQRLASTLPVMSNDSFDVIAGSVFQADRRSATPVFRHRAASPGFAGYRFEEASANDKAGSGVARQLVRTARVALEVDDVEAALSGVRLLIDPDLGEYVEDASSASRSGGDEAMIVLRVLPARLEAVLGGGRGLGRVLSERVTQEDVTDQLVDLEARLRNERRVEADLLDLLESKEDESLVDLMAVRKELARIRGEIERMDASRMALAERVALARVEIALTSHRSEVVRPVGYWGRTGEKIGRAWRSGLEGVSGSVAWIVETAVGGLIWWMGVAVAVLVGWRVWKRIATG